MVLRCALRARELRYQLYQNVYNVPIPPNSCSFVSSAGNDTEILQIAATDGADEFEVYVLPTKPISSGASSVNKLTFQRGILFHKGRPVQAVPLEEALSRMIAWLKPKSSCLLIAHNCKCFDAKHLMKAFESTGLYKEFSAIVPGFSDTLGTLSSFVEDENENEIMTWHALGHLDENIVFGAKIES